MVNWVYTNIVSFCENLHLKKAVKGTNAFLLAIAFLEMRYLRKGLQAVPHRPLA